MKEFTGAPTLLAALLIATPSPLGAQEGEPAPPSEEPALPVTGGWHAVAVGPRPWTPVVGVTIAFRHGSASDPESAGGTGWLLGASVRRAVLDRLDAGAAALEVDVDRSRVTYRLLAVPDRWREAYQTLESALFGRLPPAGVDRARARLREVLTFERDAPVREFEHEMVRLLAGLDDPWSRDPRGTADSLEGISVQDLLAHRGEHYRRETAAISVTGPVDAAGARELVTGIGTEAAVGAAAEGPEAPVAGPGPLDPVVVSREPVPPPPSPWGEGERVRMMRDVTSSWIAVALPVAPGTSRTGLEMYMHRLRRVLVSDPPDPGLFSAEVRLENLKGGSILLVETAVLPEATDDWERRILEAIDTVGRPLEPAFFRFHRRQFRTARLLAEARPEAEGVRRTDDLLREGRVRDLSEEIWSLEPGALAAVRARLGEPRILVFGPDLTDGSDGAFGAAGAPTTRDDARAAIDSGEP